MRQRAPSPRLSQPAAPRRALAGVSRPGVAWVEEAFKARAGHLAQRSTNIYQATVSGVAYTDNVVAAAAGARGAPSGAEGRGILVIFNRTRMGKGLTSLISVCSLFSTHTVFCLLSFDFFVHCGREKKLRPRNNPHWTQRPHVTAWLRHHTSTLVVTRLRHFVRATGSL